MKSTAARHRIDDKRVHDKRVIPAKAGIHAKLAVGVDPGLRRDDTVGELP